LLNTSEEPSPVTVPDTNLMLDELKEKVAMDSELTSDIPPAKTTIEEEQKKEKEKPLPGIIPEPDKKQEEPKEPKESPLPGIVPEPPKEHTETYKEEKKVAPSLTNN